MDAYSEKLYEIYKNIDNLKYERIHRLQEKWEQFVISECKKYFKKKKVKDFLKASELLGKDFIKEMMIPWLEMAKSTTKKYDDFKEGISSKLKEVAKYYEIIPYADQYFLLESDNGGNHHTQGYGANKYAKANLEESKMLLQLCGYLTEIRKGKTSDPDRWGVYYTTYELWANITPLDFQMLKWKGEFISVLNWAVICWRNNVNPKVYFPFLSDKDYERSQVLARDYGYVINKDNMKLEPYE